MRALDGAGLVVIARSNWYESAPVPVSDQPWFINGVVHVKTDMDVANVLARLHEVEADFGRIRLKKNDARVLDLDLLCYDEVVMGGEGGAVVPHPRMSERAFVLKPMAELAPQWCHPQTGLTIEALIGSLPADQVALPIGG